MTTLLRCRRVSWNNTARPGTHSRTGVRRERCGSGSPPGRLPLLTQCLAPVVVGFHAGAGIHAAGQSGRADDVQQQVLEPEEEAVPEAEAVLPARLLHRGIRSSVVLIL